MTFMARPLPESSDEDDSMSLSSDSDLETIPDLDKPFRFMDLPAEMRLSVYQMAVLINHNIAFTREEHSTPPISYWRVEARSKNDASSPHIWWSPPPYILRSRGPRPIETGLFLVSRVVSNEVRSVLYGSNTFQFIVDGSPHFPSSMRTPDIFGPFGDADWRLHSPLGELFRLPLLRNVRSIEIKILRDNFTHWAVKRHRSHLEYFVETLKEHNDDDNRKSLLEDLKITITDIAQAPRVNPVRPTVRPVPTMPSYEKFMFGLESLSALRGIKRVELQGLPVWYAKCLQLCIQGKGGEVKETDWPLIEVKCTNSKSIKWVWKSIRKWHQPLFNWKEYAERNGIELPDDVDKFWADLTN